MNRTKYLRGECQSCNGNIEFPAEAVERSIQCPHCGNTTELVLSVPPQEPILPKRTLIWTAVAVVILIVGLGGALAALKRAQQRVAAQKQAEAASQRIREGRGAAAENSVPGDPAAAKAGFRAAEITLQKTPGSSVVYAVGTLTNALARQRFGVKIHLDLLDAFGEKIGQASDYQQLIEPNGQWQFKALVVDKKVASALIREIKEEQ